MLRSHLFLLTLATATAHTLPHQRLNTTCPRFARVKYRDGAGAGHVFGDVLLGMELANRVNATYVMADIAEDYVFQLYGKAFENMLREFGMFDGEHRLADVTTNHNPAIVKRSWDDIMNATDPFNGQCNIMLLADDNSCVDFDAAGRPDEAFCPKRTPRLYDKHRHIVMNKFLKKHGRRTRHSCHHAITVAWHLRVGDINLHAGDASFFDNIHRQLTTVSGDVGMPITHTFYSYVGHVRPPEGFEFLSAMPNATFQGTLSVTDTLHHMSLADIVVETGSSFTAMLHTLTDGPLFLRGCPKEGCGTTYMDVEGMVKLDDKGTLLASQAEVVSRLVCKMNEKRRGGGCVV